MTTRLELAGGNAIECSDRDCCLFLACIFLGGFFDCLIQACECLAHGLKNIGSCIVDVCGCLAVMLWAVVALILGLVSGTMVGLIMTFLIVLITVVRTPLHVAKTLYVAATTDECFKTNRFLDYPLRVLVILLVPLVHVLWLVGITVAALVVGTLYYISRTTRSIFKLEFAKACSYGTKTLQLEEDSLVGQYIQTCEDLTDNWTNNCIVTVLKFLCSLLPGILLGVLPFLPFTLGIVLITLYRLPINLYKSMKIAVITVTMKWDLKICALLMIPVAHIVFLVVVSFTALVGSFFAFIIATTMSIEESKSPFEHWGDILKSLDDYYIEHKEFVGEEGLGRYDQPNGIPLGWRGNIYGLPIHKILQWQWDFLVCCCVMVPWTLTVCFPGSVVIFAVKIIPGIFMWWGELFEHIAGESTAECLGCWAFYLVAFILTPVAALLMSYCAIIFGTLSSLRALHIYLRYGCLAGFHEPFHWLREIDSWDFFLLDGFRVFGCIPDENPYKNDTNRQHRRARRANARPSFSNNCAQTTMSTNSYWDRFATQCIQTAAGLLDKGWITRDQVEGMEPAVLQAIPAIAVLTILVDSLHDPKAKKTGDISWKLDGTVCKEKDRPPLDNIGEMLWPRVVEVKRLLKAGRKSKDITKETNIEIIMAMICSSTGEPTDELEAFVKSNETEKKDRHEATNNLIRAKLIELTLIILQVKPFRDRMTLIFGHKYAVADEEEGGVLGEAEAKNEPNNESPTRRGWWSSWWSSSAAEASEQ